MRKKKIILYLTGALLTISAIMYLQSCSKQNDSATQAELMINKYYIPLKSMVTSSYGYAANSILSNQSLNFSEMKNVVAPFITPELNDVRVIRYDDSIATMEYHHFYENYIAAIKSQKLLTHQDYLSFGVKELQKIKNENEKKSAAFLIALGNSSTDYLLSNSDEVINISNILRSQYYRDKYLDPTTGLQLNIYPSAQVVKVIGIVVSVVAIAAVGFAGAYMWAVAGIASGGLGLAVGSAGAWVIGIVGGIGAGIGGYVGICPTILSKAECGLIQK